MSVQFWRGHYTITKVKRVKSVLLVFWICQSVQTVKSRYGSLAFYTKERGLPSSLSSKPPPHDSHTDQQAAEYLHPGAQKQAFVQDGVVHVVVDVDVGVFCRVYHQRDGEIAFWHLLVTAHADAASVDFGTGFVVECL